MMKHLLVAVLCCLSCSPSDAEKARRCESFGRDVALPTKVAESDCMVQCPAPVGWIMVWMWTENHGCGARTK